MYKVIIVLTFIAITNAKPGQEAPPPKAVTYNVPSVAKVAYPGSQVQKSVETYSAPSIEKTTTITRTITAPLNAPNVQSVQYSAPAAPLVAAAGPVAPVAAFGGYGAPGVGYGVPFAAQGYAAPVVKGYAVPTLSLGAPVSGPSLAAYSPQAGYGGIGGATVYNSPSLGYNLGQNYLAAAPVAYAPVAAAPVYAKYGAPSKY